MAVSKYHKHLGFCEGAFISVGETQVSKCQPHIPRGEYSAWVFALNLTGCACCLTTVTQAKILKQLLYCEND